MNAIQIVARPMTQGFSRSGHSRHAMPLLGGLLLIASFVVAPASGVNFVFDIEYLGNDVTQLAAGSDEPTGTSLDPGDTFQWTLASNDDRFWLVETGGSFFPLMAFFVKPSGIRTGDFSLVLR